MQINHFDITGKEYIYIYTFIIHIYMYTICTYLETKLQPKASAKLRLLPPKAWRGVFLRRCVKLSSAFPAGGWKGEPS